MDNEKLLRLIQAVETGDMKYYHCDIREGVVEGLKELVELREKLDEIKDVIN